jgi:hypothetical protein
VKPHPSEAEFTATVIKMAQLLGWKAAHFRPARTKSGWVTPVQGDGKGFPDLVLIKPHHRLVVAELKVGKNQTRPEQKTWIYNFMSVNVSTFVWTPDDWEQIEKVLGAKPC